MNPARGEASFRVGDAELTLRPSFAALVAAEGEIGPLFAFAERAAAGQLALGEIAVLFDHLSREGRPAAVTRERIGEALVAGGMVAAMPAVKAVLTQVLSGRA